jgi:hypothetical protein
VQTFTKNINRISAEIHTTDAISTVVDDHKSELLSTASNTKGKNNRKKINMAFSTHAYVCYVIYTIHRCFGQIAIARQRQPYVHANDPEWSMFIASSPGHCHQVPHKRKGKAKKHGT